MLGKSDEHQKERRFNGNKWHSESKKEKGGHFLPIRKQKERGGRKKMTSANKEKLSKSEKTRLASEVCSGGAMEGRERGEVVVCLLKISVIIGSSDQLGKPEEFPC